MTTTTPAAGGRAETEAQTERRMRQVAAELSAAGLDSRVHDTQGWTSGPRCAATAASHWRSPMTVTGMSRSPTGMLPGPRRRRWAPRSAVCWG